MTVLTSQDLDPFIFDQPSDLNGSLDLIVILLDEKCREYAVVIQILALDVPSCEQSC